MFSNHARDVYVCACVRACVRARVRACVCVCVIILQHALITKSGIRSSIMTAEKDERPTESDHRAKSRRYDAKS